MRIHDKFQNTVRIWCWTDTQTQARLNHTQIPLKRALANDGTSIFQYASEVN